MAVMAYDELNNREYARPTNKAIPYEQYFGEMDLDEEEIEERIAMAEDLESDAFGYIFTAIAVASTLGALEGEQYYIDSLYERYRDVVEKYGYSVDNGYELVDDYIYGASELIVGNTFKNMNNAYFFSDDRAMFCAEEESNSVGECKAFVKALLQGKRYKTWSAIIDKRTRDSHRDYNGTSVPITEPFDIRGSLLMYPRDVSLGAAAEEIVGCRCSALYS